MDEEFASFEQELEQFLNFETPETGDIRKGTIVSISSQGMIVALANLKRDGIVPSSDLNKLDDADRSSMKVEDEISVRVVSTSDPDSLIVSVFQALVVEDWDRAESLKASGDMIEVSVSGYNKGGLIAPFGRLRGFIPLSQVSGFSRNLNDRERQRRMAKMRTESIPVKVIEVDRERRRLVFSQREGQRERDTALREEFLKTVTAGAVMKGRVRSIRDFGVFVDLGEADGLIHVSELAWHRVKHPRDVVKVGDELEVQVLRVDIEQQRISLSRKPLLENPWDVIDEKYGENQLVDGVVVRIADYGAFVELEPGVEGLLHITQLSRSNVEDVREIVQEGERHLLRVLTVDNERQRIRLSLKAVSANEQIEWMTAQSEAAAKAAEEEAAAAEASTDEAASDEASETTEAVEVAESAEVAEEAAPEAAVEEVVETEAPAAEAEEAAPTEEVAEVAEEAVEEVAAEAEEAVEAVAEEVTETAEAEVVEATEEAVEEVIEEVAVDTADDAAEVVEEVAEEPATEAADDEAEA